jgi:hypothetical protein
VTRAIAIATERPYQEVYDSLGAGIVAYGEKHHDKVARYNSKRGRTTARDGVHKEIYHVSEPITMKLYI